jgi:hypothetical protein
MLRPSGLPAGARFISKPYRYEHVVLELEAVIPETAHIAAGDAGMPSSNPEDHGIGNGLQSV